MQVKFFDEFGLINREVLARTPAALKSGPVPGAATSFAAELTKAEAVPNVKGDKLSSGAGVQPDISLKPAAAELEINSPTRLVPAPIPHIKTATKHYDGVGKLTSPKASLAPSSLRQGAGQTESTIKEIGRRLGLDPLLGLAVAKTESSLQPDALSADGHSTKGLFQLKDSTGIEVMERLGLTDKYDPYNPEQNSQLGLSHLLELHKLFKSGGQLVDGVTVAAAADSSSVERFALAAFNAGQGRVAEAQQRAKAAGRNPAEFNQVKDLLPEITRNYVDRVLAERGLSAQQEGQDE